MAGWLLTNINVLEKGLNTAWQRNQVIANNLANIDTPGFKATHVEFESILADEVIRIKVEPKTTNAKHIGIESIVNQANSSTSIKNKDSSMRMDGNNVDVDAEMVKMARNTVLYNALVQKASRDLIRIKTAIKEVR